MNRKQLYALVWEKPMTKLAIELGISDVGLAKACRRNGIPVPPRGHWAKLAAGKISPTIPLPNPEIDITVKLILVDAAERAKDKAIAENKRKAFEKRKAAMESVIAENHEVEPKTHPLVKETLKYIERIPALIRRYERLPAHERFGRDVEYPPYLDKGRRHLRVPNGLELPVSDESAVWAVSMHDKLIKSLSKLECRFFMEKRTERESIALTCELAEEKIYINFSEGYRKFIFASEVETADTKRPKGESEWEWRPSGRFSWSIRGAEYSIHYEWAGKRAEIEAKFPDIAASCLDLLERQPAVREARIAEETRRRIETENRERKQRNAAARREQLDNAIEIAQIYAKELELKAFLKHVESELPQYTADFQPKLTGWLAVVRDELESNPPHQLKLESSILQPYWRSDAPDWWPTDLPWSMK